MITKQQNIPENTPCMNRTITIATTHLNWWKKAENTGHERCEPSENGNGVRGERGENTSQKGQYRTGKISIAKFS